MITYKDVSRDPTQSYEVLSHTDRRAGMIDVSRHVLEQAITQEMLLI